VSVDTAQLQKNFAKDLSNLYALVVWAADMQLHGSYSQRRPDLGKNVTCPFCHTRRLQGEPKCCNAKYATTQRAWDSERGFHQVECAERVVDNFFPKGFTKRLMHKKHGQSRAFKIRQLTHRFQNEPKLLGAAVAEMQERWPLLKMPELAHIPAFTERYWKWAETKKVKKQKKQSELSRKINRES
jgi:hypothetical protein